MSEQGEPVANSLVYDDSLEQEIIEGDTDLSKEIYVEAGTTVDRIRDPYGLESLDEDGELVCTTMTVVIAASIAIVLLQISILSTCLLCLYFSRSSKQSQDHHQEPSHPSYRTSTPVYHDNYGFRPSSRQSRISEYSDKTLQSLRTSLRD